MSNAPRLANTLAPRPNGRGNSRLQGVASYARAKPAFAGSSFTLALDEESLDLAADLDEKFEVMEASLNEKEG